MCIILYCRTLWLVQSYQSKSIPEFLQIFLKQRPIITADSHKSGSDKLPHSAITLSTTDVEAPIGPAHASILDWFSLPPVICWDEKLMKLVVTLGII